MSKNNVVELSGRDTRRDELTELIREGAGKLIREGLEAEEQLWTKGESSGHYQRVESIQLDCDFDTLLLTVTQEGGIACHTGRHHCFFMTLQDDDWQTTEKVIKTPSEIYTKPDQ